MDEKVGRDCLCAFFRAPLQLLFIWNLELYFTFTKEDSLGKNKSLVKAKTVYDPSLIVLLYPRFCDLIPTKNKHT
jgi:hypothetical protein